MNRIDYESEYREIIQVLREHGGRVSYRILNDLLCEKIEGVRLRLKSMKDIEIVDFEGNIPSFNSTIRIGEKARLYRY